MKIISKVMGINSDCMCNTGYQGAMQDIIDAADSQKWRALCFEVQSQLGM